MWPAERQTAAMTISTVVSGGHTGVDQGVLHACRWIDFQYNDWMLNVVDIRESKKPGVRKAALIYMRDVLGKANGKCYYPPPMR